MSNQFHPQRKKDCEGDRKKCFEIVKVSGMIIISYLIMFHFFPDFFALCEGILTC